MKRYILMLAAMLTVMTVFFGCNDKAKHNADEISESTCPYALMHDGVMYYYTGEEIYEKVEYTEEDILGSVTSVIPESGMPQVNGQANIPIEGSIFIRHELSGDGLLVLIDGKWNVFETRA